MPKIIQYVTEIDGYKFSPTTTWYCECDSSEDRDIQIELAKIPNSVSSGSYAQVLTPEGLMVYMKHSSGNWFRI